jgi:hypothetical protein
MTITTRLSRRVIASASVAAAAVLVPTAALAASGSPAAPAHAAAAPRCTHPNTRVWLGNPGDSALPGTYYQLQFSNVGHSACSLFGYPGVSEINAKGQEVGLPSTKTVTPVSTVTLRPGQTAHVVLFVGIAQNYGSCSVKNGTALRVFPPNQKSSWLIHFPAQMCAGKSTMSADPVHPGTGIPGYTIR